VRRLLQFDGKPIVVDEIYLPGAIFGTLTLEMLRDSQGSLYSFFESHFDIRMVRAEERLRAVPADRVSAELLNVAEGSPLLSVERLSFSLCRQACGMAARLVCDPGTLAISMNWDNHQCINAKNTVCLCKVCSTVQKSNAAT